MQIVSNSEAFQKGVRELRDLVGSTMGPAGGNVALTLLAMPGAIYRDGAKVIENYQPDDVIEQNAVGRIRDAALATLALAGDGTSTTTVLLATLYLHAIGEIERREASNETVNRRLVVDYIDKLLVDIEQRLIANAIKVTAGDKIDMDLLRKVATISANNTPEIGNVVAELVAKIGAEGSVQVEYSRTGELETELIPGYVFPSGLYDAASLPRGRRQVVYNDPYIVLINDTVTKVEDLNPIVDAHIKQNDGRFLIFICADLAGVALSSLITPVDKAGNILPIVAMKPPAGVPLGQFFEDMAALTGAKVFDKSKGQMLGKDQFRFPYNCGTVPKLLTSMTSTTLYHNPESAPTKDLLERLRQDHDDAPKVDQPAIQVRINRLNGSVGVIRIPGSTQGSVIWSGEIVDDSYRAAQNALKHGVLPGCGKGLLQAFHEVVDINGVVAEDDPEQLIAVMATNAAVKSIAAQVFTNAGATKDVIEEIVLRLRNLPNDETYMVNAAFTGIVRQIDAELSAPNVSAAPNTLPLLDQSCLGNATQAGVLDSAYGVICAVKHTRSEVKLWLLTKNWIKQ